MPLKIEQFEQIEAYLHDAMEPEERQAFETQIAADESLRAAVEEYQTLYEGLRHRHRFQAYLEEVQTFAAQLPPVELPTAAAPPAETSAGEAKVKTLRPALRRRRWPAALAAAAAVLLLIFAGGRWYSGVYFQNVAEQSYVHEGFGDIRQLGAIQKMDLLALMEEINQLDKTDETAYRAALERIIAQLSEIKPGEEGYLRVQYVLAKVYFMAGDYRSAAGAYDYVLEHNTIRGQQVLLEVDAQKLEWDRILAHTGSGQLNKALRQDLAAIINTPDHPHRNEAIELEEKINGFWGWWR
jgi:hypothetical protein